MGVPTPVGKQPGSPAGTEATGMSVATGMSAPTAATEAAGMTAATVTTATVGVGAAEIGSATAEIAKVATAKPSQ